MNIVETSNPGSQSSNTWSLETARNHMELKLDGEQYAAVSSTTYL